jgi:DNA-binding MarR family transcriptional regulator
MVVSRLMRKAATSSATRTTGLVPPDVVADFVAPISVTALTPAPLGVGRSFTFDHGGDETGVEVADVAGDHDRGGNREILSALTLIAEPVKPSTLADVVSMERSTMSRNLAVMQDRGWIAPTPTSATGRSMTVAITDAGTATLASADAAWNDTQSGLLEAMGPEAAHTIDGWLGQLTS